MSSQTSPRPVSRIVNCLWPKGNTLSKAFGIGLAIFAVALIIFVDKTGEDWREDWPDASAKVEAGDRTKVKPAEMARTAAYWGACAGSGVAILLLLTRCVWVGESRPATLGSSGKHAPSGEAKGRRRFVVGTFWFVVILAMVVGTVLRMQRMEFSFYNDENHVYTRIIAGQWKGVPGEDGAEFKQPSWGKTAFSNQTGNNGFLYSITARAVFDAWRAKNPIADGTVVEWVPRSPVLVFGVLTILVIALAGHALKGPWAGAAAAWILALHPWHLRFSTEARAYGMAMFFVVMSIWLLVKCWQTNAWRWWLPYGLTQLLTVYTYPGTIFFVLSVNVVLAGLLGLGMFSQNRRAAGVSITRLSVSGLLAAIPAMMLLVVPVLETREAMNESAAVAQESVDPRWWADSVTSLFVGCPWFNFTPDSRSALAMEYAVDQGIWLLVLGLALSVLAGFVGIVMLFKHAPTRAIAWVLMAGLGSLGLLYFNSAQNQVALMTWYAAPMVPVVVLIMGVGVGAVATRLGRGGFAAAAPAFVLLAVVTWGILLTRPISVVTSMPKADPRAVVRSARGGDFPDFDERPITLSLWFDGDNYDPYLTNFPGDDSESLRLLDRSITLAEEEGRPLFVYVAQTNKARSSHPKTMERLSMGGEFSRGVYQEGLGTNLFDNYAYEWRPRVYQEVLGQ